MKVALICTQGFADVLSLARQNRPDPYALHVPPSPWGQLVPPERRLEVTGRIDANGCEVETMGPIDVDAIAAMRPDAVAICLLFGHRNSLHETRVAQQVRQALPSVKIVCSHEVATAQPGMADALDGEFERTLATLAMLGLSLPDDALQSPSLKSHPFEALCDAMQAKLVEAAFSSVVREAMDCAAALFMPDGRLLSQARSLPLLLGSLEPAVRGLLQAYPAQTLRPGDGLLTNDPWSGGTHLPDFILLRPVFEDGILVALLACSLHHQDVGGIAPGSLPTDARSVVQEGLRLPPLRLYQLDVANDTWLQVLSANSRQPKNLLGDLAAQWASLMLGEGLLVDWLKQHTVHTFTRQAQALMTCAEAATRIALKAVPDGQWTATDALDGDGITQDPVPLSVTLRKRGDALTIDLRACAPQTAGPLNSSKGATYAAVSYFAHAMGRMVTDAPPNNGTGLETAPLTATNHGSLLPISVLTRAGTVVDPTWPAPVNARTNTVKMLTNLFWAAWAQAVPTQSPAPNAGVAVVLVLSGTWPDTGVPWQFTEIIASAAGGAPWGSGGSGVSTDVGNARNTPVEVIERQAPLQMLRASLRAGSGGSGVHRGGDGVVREYRLLQGRGEVMYRGERHTSQAQGAAGGSPGASASARLVRGIGAHPGEVVELPAKVRIAWVAGDVLRIETAGGGGWGRPEPSPTQHDPPNND